MLELTKFTFLTRLIKSTSLEQGKYLTNWTQ